MVHPHFPGTEGARIGEMLAGYKILPIRSPYSIVQQPEIFFCDLFWIGAIPVHYPDIIRTTSVAGIADLFPIRTVTWLYLKGHSALEQFRFAAGNGHRIDIPQHIESNIF